VRLRTAFGFYIMLDPADHVGWAIIMHGNWEPTVTDLVRRSLTDGDVFVDVGANYGWHALSAAAVLNGRSGRVVAYEPQEKLWSLLRASAELNGFGHLSVVHAAVADESSWAMIRLPKPDRVELGAICVTGNPANGVKVVALDQEFADQAPPTVVMIDAEGFELRVLRGMRTLLKQRSLRCLFIEIHPPLMANLGDEPEELVELLRDSGLGISAVGRNGELRPVSEASAIVGVSSRSGCCNIMAVRD